MKPALALTPSDPCLDEEDILCLARGQADGALLVRAQDHGHRCQGCRRRLALVARSTGERAGWTLPDRPPRAFRDGATLAGRYRVRRWLGRGGMGEVYEVDDLVLGEKVALKSLALETFFDDAAVVQIRAETSLARRVTHPNVCRVFDLVFHDEADRARNPPVPLLTMELLDGATLTSRLRERGPLPLAEAHDYARQIAAGLDAAHAAGVAHQDLKSDNIMLVGQGDARRAVITDFGLAASLSVRSQRSFASPAGLRGTMGYIAPERFAGRPATPASDVYSFGVVLRQLVTGGLPFASDSGAVTDTPRSWASVIERCLAHDPAARFPSAGAAVAALTRSGRRRFPSRWILLSGALLVLLGTIAVSFRQVSGPAAPVAVTPAPRPIERPSAPPPIGPPAPPVPPPSAALRSAPLPSAMVPARPRVRRPPARLAVPSRKQPRRLEDEPIDPFAPTEAR
jgi:serine/threonine protein kinase